MGSPVSIGDVFALIRLSHHLIEAFRHGPSDLVDAQRRHFALNTALEALKDDFISNAAATVEDLAHQEQMGRIVLDTTQMLSALDKELSKYIEVPTSPNDRGDKKWYSFPRPSKPWKKVKWGLEGNQLVGKMCDELTTHTTLILGVLNK